MQTSPTQLADTALRLERLAREAGRIAMGFWRPGARTSAEVQFKHGGSPVTAADFAVDRFLFEGVAGFLPEAGWLSEETTDDPRRLTRKTLIVVDPIDGTSAFMRGDPRWAVSIALVEDGRPAIGIVHAPALERTFVAQSRGGAFLNGAPIAVSSRDALAGAALVVPTDMRDFLERSSHGFDFAKRTPSLALRIAQIAMGEGDLAIAKANSRDWDIAAADVILTEAGGVLAELDGAPLAYNRPSSRRDMLVAAPRALIEATLALAKAAQKGSP